MKSAGLRRFREFKKVNNKGRENAERFQLLFATANPSFGGLVIRAGALAFTFVGKGVKLSRNNRSIEWFNQ
jgi:hypothetical protein